ncbi:hypothetical protein T265_01104 [Opisthorchis viverrini]|uniref:Uncharacterized protein n=1 Tax=Opisthorchis viverrini TaxID=6198 RepID=A0A075AJA1_OPIVI|nr:hypothetical protein T265_01104 [Opisthorchis viverrini]KER33024.1 hypothetical protein T265_01104 [Opisthorchis viverrini]
MLTRSTSGTDSRIHGFEAFAQDFRVDFVLAQVKKGCSTALYVLSAGQYACQREDSHRLMSNCALNWVLKRACTTVGGRLFHAATTQNEKQFCLVNVCALSLKIFLLCPRRVFAWSTAGNHSRGGPLDTLNEGDVFCAS